MNKKEFYKEKHYKKQNWLHSNGRVNAATPNNIVGVSVSPYMKDFKSQVDIGVWPLVEILVKKGYLPCSSCESHDWLEGVFVVVCFGSKSSRDNFAKQVINARIPRYRILYQDSQINVNLYNPSNKYYKINKKMYFLCPDTKVSRFSKEQETENWNYCFNRKYKKWYFCRLLIGGAILDRETPITLLSYWTRYFWIKKLTNFIKKKVSNGYD